MTAGKHYDLAKHCRENYKEGGDEEQQILESRIAERLRLMTGVYVCITKITRKHRCERNIVQRAADRNKAQGHGSEIEVRDENRK